MRASLLYHPFPTSNHNLCSDVMEVTRLYIIPFLHQTTTLPNEQFTASRCISSLSYIKPQPFLCVYELIEVVYHPFPTSNHNGFLVIKPSLNVVYHPFPTSNHNWPRVLVNPSTVVYHPFPTSNHNSQMTLKIKKVLYIIPFLHQTTT